MLLGNGYFNMMVTEPGRPKWKQIVNFIRGMASAFAVKIVVYLLLINPALWNAMRNGQG